MSHDGSRPAQIMGVLRAPVAHVERKRCPVCREWRPLEEFGVDRYRPDGLNHVDRICKALLSRERRAKGNCYGPEIVCRA
jgi:hypothetical protein